jgi:site-specific DNA-methyltransferase (adenine-specific)
MANYEIIGAGQDAPKKYKIIYADPPWAISFYPVKGETGMKFTQYKTMKLHAIKALPVKNISTENASIFMWTTNTFLPDALEVMKEWGFKYHCTIVWKKDNGITMRGVHRTVEFLLFGYNGKYPNIGKGKPLPCHVEHKRGKHSEKPDIFRKIIVDKFGDIPRIELFARQRAEGWDAWGDEIEESPVLGEKPTTSMFGISLMNATKNSTTKHTSSWKGSSYDYLS